MPVKLEPRKSQIQPPDATPGARAPRPEASRAGFEGDRFRASQAAPVIPEGVAGLGALLEMLGQKSEAKEKPKAQKKANWSEKNPMPKTPKGQATVLSANLREGLVVDPGDVAHTRDMKNFVNRVAKQAPYAPDVLTLSEVIGPSAQNVARLLSARTGRRYEVVSAPGRDPFTPGPVTRDTAVLVNTETFSVEKRGFIPVTTPKGTNMQAYARLKQKGSHLRLNVASVHFPATSAWDLGREDTTRWRMRIGRQVNAFLERTEGGRHSVNVIAGDLNTKKSVGKKETPLYKAITDKWGYKDSLLEKSPEQAERDRIDYIFTQGRVVDAEKDHTYTREMIDSGFRNGGAKDPATGDKRERKHPKRYYSDHAFEWAIVGKARPESK